MNILRCPWCHSTAIIHPCNLIVSGHPLSGGRVVCGNAACGACGPARLSSDEAIRVWNALKELVLEVEQASSSDWINPNCSMVRALEKLEVVGAVPDVTMEDIRKRLEGGA